MSESVYRRIDRMVYQVERGLVVIALVVMAVVVFLDVVHRSFSSEQSKFALAVARLAGWVGVEIAEGSERYQQLADASPTILLVIFVALAYFGIRSAKRISPVPPLMAALGAVAGVLVAYGLVRLLLMLLPNGLIWSQNLALVLTLWVGFVGASMCTHEGRHLKVEAVQRFLPERWRPVVGFGSGVLTAVVCAALLWLSLRYVLFNYQEYEATSGKGGLFLGMNLPRYQGFAALPVAFGFMTIRFAAKAIGALQGEVEQPLDPVVAAGVGPASIPDSLGRMPSEVATEAVPSDHIERESSIDTVNPAEPDHVRPRSRPPSEVPTAAHAAVPLPIASSQDEADDEDDELLLGDPDQTRELEDGPLLLSEETAELPDDLLGNDPEGPR